jgi:hypothetical protein
MNVSRNALAVAGAPLAIPAPSLPLAHGGMGGILMAQRAPIVITAPIGANTLTALIGDLYAAMDVVSRELVGFASSVTLNPSVARAAVGQAVNFPVAPAQTAYDVTPSMTVPTPPDNTFITKSMAITKSRAVPFGLTGEEQRAINSPQGGPGVVSVQAMVIAQAIRTLVNEVEADLSVEAATNASRAYGTGGTIPFGSGDLTDLAQIEKILDDNGAPRMDRVAVLNTTAAAKLITLNNLARVNEAGSTLTLRRGELLDIYGMSVKKSGQFYKKTKGTAASATTNNAGYAVGARTITLASAGTGTITAGDVITFAGDTNKYVVETGDASVADGGTIVLREPGLRVAIPTANTAITVGNSYEANVAFSASAMHLATRAPAIPVEGDAASDRLILTDPYSGLSFEFAIYLGYKMVRYEVSMAWGVKASKPEHIALLLG